MLFGLDLGLNSSLAILAFRLINNLIILINHIIIFIYVDIDIINLYIIF